MDGVVYPEFQFSQKDIECLRRLAERVAYHANSQEMRKKAQHWKKHNDLETEEPLVLISPENGWGELLDAKSMECENPLARSWEWGFRAELYWAEVLKDDKVVLPFFDVPYCSSDTGWGVDIGRIGGQNGSTYVIKRGIEDYEEDFKKLHHPQIIIDWEKSNQMLELANEIFAGILTVRRNQGWWWSLGLSNDYIHLRGLEDFMCDFVTEPEWVKKMFEFLCQGKLDMLDYLEENGLLSQNTEGSWVGSGGFGYTSQIPQKAPGERIGPMDMWGFCESQETVCVDPDMYGEFIYPCHKKIMERFALNCYGCCEPFDRVWKYVKNTPRLRRVSVSPWANWASVPDLLGKDYIASVKPNPVSLAQADFDEAWVRKDCRRAVEETKGGICEFIMKDTHTFGKSPHNAARWVQIMREEVDRIYG